jgi:uncharacterized protein
MNARLQFFGSLRDFLSKETASCPIEVSLAHHSQMKDTIESLGVPHCEIDLILLNGRSADFRAHLKDGDQVLVYPVDKEPVSAVLSLVRPPELAEKQFVVDSNLGKLKSMMRALGFDCLYDNAFSDADIAEISASQRRIILTKDVGLLMRAKVVYGYWVRSQIPRMQIREVIKRYNLESKINLLSRCVDCNVAIESIEKEKVWNRLEPLTKKYYDQFSICPSCHKIFWQGSHYEKIHQWSEDLRSL